MYHQNVTSKRLWHAQKSVCCKVLTKTIQLFHLQPSTLTDFNTVEYGYIEYAGENFWGSIYPLFDISVTTDISNIYEQCSIYPFSSLKSSNYWKLLEYNKNTLNSIQSNTNISKSHIKYIVLDISMSLLLITFSICKA